MAWKNHTGDGFGFDSISVLRIVVFGVILSHCFVRVPVCPTGLLLASQSQLTRILLTRILLKRNSVCQLPFRNW